ncbi:MAG TPA: hypothetical protein VF062_22975 [Candidatus Limnocylindrales bacterium]
MALLVPSQALGVPVRSDPIPSATFDGAVQAAVYSGDVIYLGGDFTHAIVNGIGYRRDRLAAVDARTGALLDWTPSANGRVTAIAVDSSGVYVGGDFTAIDLKARDNLAKLSRFDGQPLPGFQQRIYGSVRAVAVGGGRVYAGGSISQVGREARGRLAAFDAETGSLDTGWAPMADDNVYSLLATDDRVYVGGRFGSIDGYSKTQKLAAVHPVTGEVDGSFQSRVHAYVNAIVVSGGAVYAGIDGGGGRATAMSLSGDLKWTVSMDGDIKAMALLDDHLYVGGHFDAVCKTNRLGTIDGMRGSQCLDGSYRRIKMAAFSLDGGLQPWAVEASGTVGVSTMMANPSLGQLLVGGYFKHVNGAGQERFALFNLSS